MWVLKVSCGIRFYSTYGTEPALYDFPVVHQFETDALPISRILPVRFYMNDKGPYHSY